jgi:uncharacterized membrane protein YvbJ
MALIRCPECGTEVSDKAEECPKCAYPINKTYTRPSGEPPKIIMKPKEGCFLQTLNVGCLIVAIIIGIIGLAIFVGLCSH